MIKGKAQRLGHVCGKAFRRYLSAETKLVGWLLSKRVPVSLCELVTCSTRLLLLATVGFLLFWVAMTVGGIWLLKMCLKRNPVPVHIVNDRWFDGDALFPDPYSAENMNDPAFYRDEKT